MPATSPPNLLFLFPDQLGARWTALDGHPLIHTPRLLELARESTVFTPGLQQFAAVHTLARLSAQRALAHADRRHAQRPGAAAGYAHPGGASERGRLSHGLAGQVAFERRATAPPARCCQTQRGGFQRFAGWESHHVDHWRGQFWTDESPEAQLLAGHETDGLTAIAQEWLPQLPQPFCLFVSYQAPHPPCAPPPEFQARYAGRDLMCEPNVDPGAWYHMPQWDADYDLQTFRERYYGEIMHLDAAVGRLLDTLAASVTWRSNTALCFTSDHGEMNGAHGLFSKGVMYDESLRVPLLLRLPGQTQGRRCETPVGTVDLLPTLLDLAGAAPDPGVPGRSLLPALRGESLPERPLFSECGEPLCVLGGGLETGGAARVLAAAATLRHAARPLGTGECAGAAAATRGGNAGAAGGLAG